MHVMEGDEEANTNLDAPVSEDIEIARIMAKQGRYYVKIYARGVRFEAAATKLQNLPLM